jgi:hemerythrin-like domain-containing protein
MDWYEGPLADLRREHRQERYLMRTLRHSARRSDRWETEDKRQFVSVGRAFTDFMRKHMQMENELFKVAAQQLTQQQKDTLVEEFDRFDEEVRKLPDYESVRSRALKLVQAD